MHNILNQEALGSALVGDLNVHHSRWLRYSSRNSVEGEALRDICDEIGLQQLVKELTRGENLLDLCLTDIDEVRCKTVPKIADHKGLCVTLPLSVPKVEVQSRLVWQDADWDGLSHALSLVEWSHLL